METTKEMMKRGGVPKVTGVLTWAEENAEEIIKYYLPDTEPNLVFESSELRSKGDYLIDQDKSTEAYINICFGDAYDKANKEIESDYDGFIRKVMKMSDGSPLLDPEVLTNDEDKTVMFLFTKHKFEGGGKVTNGDRVRIPKDLTSDPYQRRGEIGVIQEIKKGVATVKFSKKHKGKYVGKYKIDSLESVDLYIPPKEEDSEFARGGKVEQADVTIRWNGDYYIARALTEKAKKAFATLQPAIPDTLNIQPEVYSREKKWFAKQGFVVVTDLYPFANSSQHFARGGNFSAYNKESVKNILVNEGVVYGVHHFLSPSDIEKSETKLRQWWKSAQSEMDKFENKLAEKEVQEKTKIGKVISQEGPHYPYMYLKDTSAEIYSDASPELKKSVNKINSLLKSITDYLGIKENEYAKGGKFKHSDLTKSRSAVIPKEEIPVEQLVTQNIRNFFPPLELKQIIKNAHGEESNHFRGILTTFDKRIADMPATYETDEVPQAEKVAWLHYFSPSSDWYIIEKDKGSLGDATEDKGKQFQAWGYVILNGDRDNAEFGYISIEELKTIPSVELDLYFSPVKLSEALLKKQGEERIERRGQTGETNIVHFIQGKPIPGEVKAEHNALNPLAQEQIQNPVLESLHYEPESDACLTLDTNVPAAMRFEIKQALANIDRRVNGVDEFVAQKLHYVKNKCTPDEYKEGLKCLCDAFAAEQVDAIAVAIYNIESKGYATINADMTGIGKGRVAAGLLRYGLMHEITPIFFTEKPNLFSDIYRDLVDIGSDPGIPLFRLEPEKKEKTVRATRKEIIEKIQDDIANGEYEEDFDADTLFNPENKKHLDGVIEIYAEKYFPSTIVLVDSYKENLSYAHDIKGKSLVKPFIVNGSGAKTDIKDGNGNILYRGLPQKQTSDILKAQVMPADSKVVLCTYSQIASSRAFTKRDFIKAIAPRSIFIFDESHNAAGDSNTGAYLLGIVSEAQATDFFSATYAKRPDNMPIYAVKTSMGDANMSQEKLVDAIKSGGVALQEVVTALLASEGQLIRRERSFEGITVDYVNLDETQNEINPSLNLAVEHRALFDMATDLLRETIKFQSVYVEHELQQIDREIKAAQKEVGLTTGTQAGGISNPPEFSGVFNIVNQILFSIKAKAVAEITIQQLKQGKKPIIAFASTMESFLDSFIKPDGLPLKEGDIIATDFAQVFLKRLQGVMRYTETDSEGNREQKVLNPQEIGGQFEAEYNRIADKIRRATTSINISPIDVVLDMISKAGYSVQEITGRQRVLKLIDDKTAQVAVRTRLPNNDLVRGFNNNEIDCLLLNQAGSTGMSAHATHRGTKLKRDEVKPRVMIVLQPELNINTEVQKRGRINRSGQLSDSKELTAEQRQYYKPSYIYVTSAVPAEQRLNMMLQRKLKSLDANTTSNQKQSRKIMDMPDFLNKYGDDLAYDYLVANPVINETLGDPLDIADSLATGQEIAKSKPDAAYKIAGRVAILPTKDQEDFYVKMSEDYEALVEYLKETGEYDLEVEALNLQAETISRDVAVVGTGDGSVFSRNTVLEKCEVNVLKKPYKAAELQSMIDAALQDGQGGQYESKQLSQLLLDEMNAFTQEMMKRELEESKKHHENLRNNIANEKGYKKLELQGKSTDAYVKERNEEINDGELAAHIRIERTWKQKQTYLQPLLKEFPIGKVIAYPTIAYNETNEWHYGIFLGFDIRRNTKNPWAPGSMKAKFALASSQKAIAVPLSKSDILNTVRALTGDNIGSFMSTAHLLEEWDKKIKEATRNRTVRYIVTGNILQAFGHEQLKGKLISYTTSSGTEKKGILLPESFSPEIQAQGQKEFRVKVPIMKAAPLIKSLTPESSMTTDNGVSIFKYDDKSYRIIVPASRERGGRFYLNPAILNLLPSGNFDKVSSNMVGNMPSRNIEKLLSILQEMRTNVDLNSTMFDLIKDTIDIEVYTDEEKFIPKSDVVLEKLSEGDKNYEEQLRQEAERKEAQMRFQYKMMKFMMMLK